MPTTIQWVGVVPEISIDADGVQVVYESGEQRFTCRTSRAVWRKFMETGIRALDLYEAQERERCTVVPFEGRQAGH